MKQSELKNCSICNKGVMHAGTPVFYRVQIESLAVDLGALQRQTGMELLMGCRPGLAQVMGPNEDIAKTIDTVDRTICLECLLEHPMAMLLSE